MEGLGLLEPVMTDGSRTISVDGKNFVAKYVVTFNYGKAYEHWTIEIHNPSQPDAVVASVIRTPGSYGYDYGLYELAFLQNNELMDTFAKDWGGNVIGYLSEEEVLRWINRMLYELGDL